MCHSGVVKGWLRCFGRRVLRSSRGNPSATHRDKTQAPFAGTTSPSPSAPFMNSPHEPRSPLGRGSTKVQPPQPPQPPPPLPGRAPPRPAQHSTARHGRAQRSQWISSSRGAPAAWHGTARPPACDATARANGRCGRERRRLAVLLVLLLLLLVVLLLLLLLERQRRRVGGRGQRPQRALRRRRPFAVSPRGETSEKSAWTRCLPSAACSYRGTGSDRHRAPGGWLVLG